MVPATRLYRQPGGSFITNELSEDNVFTPEDFSDELKMIGTTMKQFIEQEVATLGEEGKKLNYDLILKVLKKAGDLGLLGACVPEEYGGLGLDGIRFTLLKEKLNTGSADVSAAINGQIGIGMLPIIFFGTDEQRKKYLPPLIAGTMTNAFALTEPQSGTDASSIKTNAKLSDCGNYYILNGNKVFITNAGFADIFIVFAKLDGKDFTAFIVERGTEGLIIGPEEKKMGLETSSTCSLTFEDVKIPVTNMLGKPGKGLHIAFNTLNFGRLSVGASCLGNAKYALDKSIKYAKNRVQFNRPIANFPLIGKKIAEMNIKVFVLESLVYRTAALFDTSLKQLDFTDPNVGENSRTALSEFVLECSINKVFGSEVLGFVVDEALQIHGGYGYMREYEIEGMYRDARIKRIFEGTNEINRLNITRTVLKWLEKERLPELKRLMEIVHKNVAVEDEKEAKGLLGNEENLLRKARFIYAYSLEKVLKKYGKQLDSEQEVCSNLADILIYIFTIESALLRTKKLIKMNGELSSTLAVDMTKVYANEAYKRIIDLTMEILFYITGDNEEFFKGLSIGHPIDTITLKRNIAEKVMVPSRILCK